MFRTLWGYKMTIDFPKKFKIPNIFSHSAEIGRGFPTKDSPPPAQVEEGNTFNITDFSVSQGVVSLKNKTSYAILPGCAFISDSPDVQDITVDIDVLANANGIKFIAPIQLPHGARMKAAVVTGNISDETWELIVINRTTSGSATIASGNINTEDTSILGTNVTVNNETLGYLFRTSTLDTTDRIYGARITYTTDYD